MKRILLFTFTVFIGNWGFSQEIPNGGFKTFTGTVPNSWTAASASFVGKATGERRIKVNPVAKTDNDDSTAVFVTAQNVGTVKPGVIVSGVGATASVGLNGVSGGFPDTTRPAVLSGFAKYKTTVGNHGGITVILTRKNGASRDTIGGYSGKIFTVNASSKFVFFNIPITYNPLFNGIAPDSIQIVLMSSKTAPPLANETATMGDSLYVDLLRFSNCTPDPNVTIGASPTISANPPGISKGHYTLANTDSRDVFYTFTVAVPSPASVTVLGLPITIDPLDSIHLNSYSNMPVGLSVTCGHPSCTLYGNSIGCYTISGTLPSTDNVKYVMEGFQTSWGYSTAFAGQAFGNGYIQEQGARSRDTLTITVGTPPVVLPPTILPGPTIAPIAIRTAQSVDGGVRHSVFLCNDGTVMAVGENKSGELGNGTNVNSTTPAQVSNLTGIISVSAGQSFSLFLKNDSTVWACGDNTYGQLGNGTTTKSNVPVQITSLSGITAISAGYKHSLFLKKDGTVWACGANVYAAFLGNGMLGDGTTTNRATPVQVSGLTNVIGISGGASFSLFLKSDGTAWSCGSNYFGQLGTGGFPLTSLKTATKISSLSGVRAVCAGFDHSLFLKNDGTVYAAGLNICGEMADGTTSNKPLPVKIKALSEIVAVDAGSDHFLFLKNDGTVWASGINGEGELGEGTAFDKHSVVQTTISGVNAIAAGDYFSLYSKNDNTVWASGLNTYSQLGDGTFMNKMLPVQVPGLCSTKVLGIEENGSENNSSVFPNPSSGIVQITNDTKMSGIEVSNILGEIVYVSQPNTERASIDLSSNPNGIYVIKISSSKGISTEKLVLTH